MTGEDLTDDYVANLLKKDAKLNSTSYLNRGVSAFLPKRAGSNAPRANTRFLRNVIRETDSHNAALLAREKAESEARLRSLKEGRRNDDKRAQPSRSPRTDDDHYRERKRRRAEHDHRARTVSRSRSKSPIRSSRDKDGRSGRREDRTHRRSRRGRSSSNDDSEHNRKQRATRHRRRDHDEESREEPAPTHSKNSRHPERGDERTSHRSRRSEPEVSSSRRRHRAARSRSASRERGSRDHKRTEASKRNSGSIHNRSSELASINSSRDDRPDKDTPDSDPLEEFVGPLPPPIKPVPRIRGRGVTNRATIDAHFAADYDPQSESALNGLKESGSEDWDDAVEAFRDMQKWKTMGAERLRQAGFSFDDVRRWQKGGERTEEDVVWKKKGEGREWDRGKVLDDKDEVTLKPEWGRLV